MDEPDQARGAASHTRSPHPTKRNVLGVLVDAVTYDQAVDLVIAAAHGRRPFAASALAVHGVMTGVMNPRHRYRLNQMDLLTPDGQPVRWALNLLHKAGLTDRVYGPTLMQRVCERAAHESLPVFLYGCSERTLTRLQARLGERLPQLQIAGARASRFRPLSEAERTSLVASVRESGARMLFVALGCPKQEVFAYEMRTLLDMPVIAVGAAFEYNAGLLVEPPGWMQRHGLHWLHRLVQQPRRLWRRYLVLNPLYLTLLGLQALRLWRPDPGEAPQPNREFRYG